MQQTVHATEVRGQTERKERFNTVQQTPNSDMDTFSAG